MGNGGHIRINNGQIIEQVNQIDRDSRRRLDDFSDDLSSIPSYDAHGRKGRESELDREQIIFGDRD